MTDYTHLFTPLKIGRITLKNRIEFPPVGPHLGTSDGYVSRELIEWGRQYAKGGAAIVTLGDSATNRPAGPVHQSYAIHVATEKSVNPLNRFAEVIQRYGAKASIQINYHNRCSPTEMQPSEIKGIIESYAQAAQRCLRAGLDMIMVHGAHGHVLSQFVSPRTNARTDAYGGRFANRTRLVCQVLDAIRNKVGDGLAIEYRISADEMVPGGPTVEEQLELAKMLQDKIDLLHVSVANLYAPETLPMMNQPHYFPRGLNLKHAVLFKRSLKVPIVTVGSYDLPLAEEVVRSGQADVVAMARTLIADPSAPTKAAIGKASDIVPCIRCNYCINRSHYLFLATRCAVNPVVGREAEFYQIPPPVRKKKVVILGGGPAGMEAARTAAGRGHDAVLLEKEKRLGGALNAAAGAPFKGDLKAYLDWAVHSTLNTPGITVRLSADISPTSIQAEKPDVLIIGIGALPLVPVIPGIHGANVVLAEDVELGKAQTGSRVVVVGAGLTGSETALHLARQGRQVTLIDKLTLVEIDAGTSVINTTVLRKMLGDLKVETRTRLTLEEVAYPGIVARDAGGHKFEIPCDTVVLALGVVPKADQVAEFQGLAPEVHVIGDCHHQHGNLMTAVADGFFAGMEP